MAYKQHFIEWFSGKQLPSYWTKRDIAGTGTYAMADSVDGGFIIDTGATSSNKSSIDFNDKKQFNSAGTEMIFTALREGTTQDIRGGFTENTTGIFQSPATKCDAGLFEITTETYKQYGHSDGTTGVTLVDTDVAIDTSWHNYKIKLETSNNYFYIDGVLKITATTNLPDSALQPAFLARTLTSASRSMSIRYMECYNT